MLSTPWPLRTRSTSCVAVAGEHRVGAVEHEARGLPLRSPRSSRRYSIALRAVWSFTPGVEEALHDLEPHEVAVRVAALRATPPRVGQRRAHEIGAGPVVELAVRDADDPAHLGPAVAVVGPQSQLLTVFLPTSAAPLIEIACYTRVVTPL